MSHLAELLQVFKTRATDPALYGRNCRADIIFNQVAMELAQAMHKDEPEGLLAYVPISVINLVHVACHFDHGSEESWEALGNAAIDIQNGAAS